MNIMFNSRELLTLVDSISKEKGLIRSDVISYMEDAMETALRKNFPETATIQITVDADSGEITGNRLFNLVDAIEDIESQMLKNEIEDETVINGVAYEPFVVELNRQQINITKQVLLQKINNESRNKEFQSLLSRNLLLFTGVVKVMKKEQMTVDYNGLDIMIPRSHLLPRENYKIGDKVRFTIIPDRNSYIGSRTDPSFLIQLFKEEVDAVYDGKVEIVKCVRAPGFRSRIIVKSDDPSVSAVKMIIGRGGAHTNAIKSQLNGENITVIPFNENISETLIKVVEPTVIYNISIDENTNQMDFSVAQEDVASIIGRQGKNIASISELLGWNVNVFSVEEWDERESITKESLTKHFMTGLSCDEEIAQVIIDSGMTDIEFFRVESRNSLIDALDGLDEETVDALIQNAQMTFQDSNELAKTNAYLLLGELNFKGEEVDKLIESKILNTQDVADLATDELLDILPEMAPAHAGNIIMKARAKSEDTLIEVV